MEQISEKLILKKDTLAEPLKLIGEVGERKGVRVC